MKVDGRHYRTVWFEDQHLCLINQPRLPHSFEILRYRDYRAVADAIRTMVVRGAPAIGATGAFGMALAEAQGVDLEQAARTLRNTRPTAQDLFYGIDTVALASLGSGTFTLRAFLDTTAEEGMWNGRVASSPVTVHLRAGAAGERTVDRLYAVGLYRWLDHDYEASLGLAEKILAREPASIAGLVLAGDSLDGLGRPDEALQCFSQAFAAYSERLEAADGELEPPRYIQVRFLELQEKLGQRNLSSSPDRRQ